MPQIFRPSTNSLARATILGALLFIVGSLWLLAEINRSSYVTNADVVRDQPVPFSHEHHVAGLGIDCRYCHTSVEESAFAGIPPTETCMTCHSQVWTNAKMLEPVRDSYRTGRPLRWTRVHDLPDFTYFNHSIHVAKGVGCESCHGRVDRMPLMYQASTLQMEWCLDCHRAPEKHLRPRDQVFNMNYKPAGEQLAIGSRLVHDYNVNVAQLTDCSICHR
ncbi:MAG: cytochrome c3 family protein [bacterium]|nr:cytochrome c3 family protein [Candidatus Kapabacteria bacterium]